MLKSWNIYETRERPLVLVHYTSSIYILEGCRQSIQDLTSNGHIVCIG